MEKSEYVALRITPGLKKNIDAWCRREGTSVSKITRRFYQTLVEGRKELEARITEYKDLIDMIEEVDRNIVTERRAYAHARAELLRLKANKNYAALMLEEEQKSFVSYDT